MTLHLLPGDFLINEENFIIFFISVQYTGKQGGGGLKTKTNLELSSLIFFLSTVSLGAKNDDIVNSFPYCYFRGSRIFVQGSLGK
jgi:hypothetical protein